MTAQPLLAEPLDLAAVRTQVTSILDHFLTHKAKEAADLRMPAEVTETLRDFLLAGGKRLRPVLCVTGWHAAGECGDSAPVLRVAASLEMFHAFCLIHDDVMDNSDTRRGHPTVHRTLALRHAGGRSTTAADHLGTGAAILIGDLALAWADELLHTSHLTPAQRTRVLPLIDVMRTEVMYGQYLDLTAAGTLTSDVDRALAVIRYKTAKYTIERPLHLGAALAGADAELLAALSDFALPLGDAFQLRDDILGVYGNPHHTGKTNLDDLREGKDTALIALALQHAPCAQADQLRLFLGNPNLTQDQAEVARRIITATGARSEIEAMITEQFEQALTCLQMIPVEPAAAEVLRHLAETAVRRDT